MRVQRQFDAMGPEQEGGRERREGRGELSEGGRV